MATNFPTSVDTFTNPVSNDSLNSPSHSVQHADANDAIEAIEGYILNGTGAAWQTWAPVLGDSWLNGNGTWSAFYNQIGKTVNVDARFTIGSTTSIGLSLLCSIPVTAKRGQRQSFVGYTPRGTSMLFGTLTGTTYINLYAMNASGTYGTISSINTSVPATWVTGDTITFSFTYEAA